MKSKQILLIAAVCLFALLIAEGAGAGSGKKFSDNINRSLFSDRRAYQVGDIVTVLIVEYALGSHEAGTETKSQNDLGLSAVGSGDLSDINSGVNGQWKNQHEGTGETTRKGTLQGTITARIVEITESGNLTIEGERTVVVNGEKQVTTLRGIVRPEDISGQNTVYSYNIADAQIGYTGKGDVNNASKPGFITRIINWIF